MILNKNKNKNLFVTNDCSELVKLYNLIVLYTNAQ